MPAPYLDDYASARAAFLEAARSRALPTWTLPLDATGPGELPLSIDITCLGPQNAPRALVHVSGVHGVEGVCGSAIQRSLLAEPPELPADTALFLVHAINPYGWAWRRRVNELNVDLNRNFLPPDRPYSGAPETYARLDPLLNPPSPPGPDLFLPKVVWNIARHGFNSLKQAVVGGQYAYPQGLFFGGSALQQGPRLYMDWVREHLSGRQQLLVIDVHTGLGEPAYDSLLVDCDPGTEASRRLEAIFGERIIPWDPDAGVAYQIEGGHTFIYARLCSGRVDTVTQEFGTSKPLAVLKALREENRLHLHGDLGPTALDHPAKRQLLETFAPARTGWRELVLERGLTLVDQGLKGLAPST